jgi:hypothetical protein
MKKRFSLGWLLFVLWALSACGHQAPPEDNVINETPAHHITFAIGNRSPLVVVAPIAEDETRNAFEILEAALLDAQIPLSAQTSEFGIFIESLGHLNPPTGAYIMIRQNQVPISVGLADVLFEPSDVFSFEIEFWDALALARYESIERFKAQEAELFINAGSYEVFSAMGALDALESITYTPLTESETDLIRSILILRSLGEDISTLQDSLSEIYTTEFTFRAGLGLLALIGHPNYQEAEEKFIASLNDINGTSGWIDDLSMAVIALGHAVPTTLQEAFYDRLFENLNAPSLAHAIMALIVLGDDPYAYSDESGMTLIDYLLALQTVSGGFLYDFNSGIMDSRQFSSPQSFMALVVLDRTLNGDAYLPYRP